MTYAQTVIADNPIRYYRMGDLFGTTATDVGSQAQNGTLHGGITLGQPSLLASDSANAAMLFNGTTGYISMPTTGLPSGAAPWTLEAWVKPTAVNATIAIVTFGTYVSTNYADLYIDASSKLVVTNQATNFFGATTLTAGSIYHTIAVFDGTNVALYLNGVQDKAPTAMTETNTAATAYIGARDNNAGGQLRFFNGIIDEIAIYSYALSAAQVLTHYQIGTTLFTPSYAYGATTLHDGQNFFLLAKNFDLIGNVPALHKVGRVEGMTKSGTFQGERMIQVITHVQGVSRNDLESKLDTLYQGLALSQQKLTLHALDGRYFVADCLGCATELASVKGTSGIPQSSVTGADVVMSFLCANPYALSPVQSTYDTGTIALTQTGSVFSSATITFLGGGNVAVPPQLRLYTQSISGTSPAISSIAVAQTTDNQTLTIGGAIMPVAANDYLDIYCDPSALLGWQIIKNNLTTLTAIPTGVFPVLEPTATSWTISYTTTNVTALSIRAVWTWTPLFLS